MWKNPEKKNRKWKSKNTDIKEHLPEENPKKENPKRKIWSKNNTRRH